MTQSRHLRSDQKKRRAEWPAAKGQGVESYHLGSVAIKTKPVPQRLLVQLSHRVRQKDSRSDVSSKARPAGTRSRPQFS